MTDVRQRHGQAADVLIMAWFGSVAYLRPDSASAGFARDLSISNGVRMHDLLRYLTAPRTGRAVAEGLSADGAA